MSEKFDEVHLRKKCNNYSLVQKQQVLEEYNNTDNQSKLLKKYRIHPLTIEKWAKEQEQQVEEDRNDVSSDESDASQSSEKDSQFYVCKLKGGQVPIELPDNDLLDDDLLRKINYDNYYNQNLHSEKQREYSEHGGYLQHICVINIKQEEEHHFKKFYS